MLSIKQRLTILNLIASRRREDQDMLQFYSEQGEEDNYNLTQQCVTDLNMIEAEICPRICEKALNKSCLATPAECIHSEQHINNSQCEPCECTRFETNVKCVMQKG